MLKVEEFFPATKVGIVGCIKTEGIFELFLNSTL